MKAISTKHALALILSASVLAGCASNSTTDDAETMGADVTPMDQSGGVEVGTPGEAGSLSTEEMAAQQAEMERQAKEKEEAVFLGQTRSCNKMLHFHTLIKDM